MTKYRGKNGIAPFSGLVFQAIAKIQENGSLPFQGKGALKFVLTQYLNSKDYIEVDRSESGASIRLSEKGFEIYDGMLDLVEKKIKL